MSPLSGSSKSSADSRSGAVPSMLTRIAVVVSVLLAARYFLWRFEETLNPAAVWFFWIFLAAELIGFGEVLLFYVTTWRQSRYQAPPPSRRWLVDVFIPTYNEPVELLRDTALCAISMSYPHRTWLLDDGNRPEVAALARDLGCDYLAREDNLHAKAGNLNHALAHSQGDLVAVLDADHVPMPGMLEELVGFFDDPNVAIVQANQDFYNLDSFQHETRWADRIAWQQQELFFNVIQPGKDALGAAMYCGSPALLRRLALEDVGGFATETVTEDMHTSLRMQKRGWRVIYHNRSVARGLAPQTYHAYNTQWHRWGMGAMQVLRRERPIFGRGLSFKQRIGYLSSFYFYWISFQKAFFLLVPPFCVLTGVFPLLAEPRTYLAYFLPLLLFNVAATSGLQGGFHGFILTERFNLIKIGSMMRAAATGVLRMKTRFSVTPKARGAAADWRRMLPYFAIVVLLAISVVAGIWRMLDARGAFELWAYGVNVFFACFFLYLLVPGVALAMRRQELRATYRFPQRLDLPVRYRRVGVVNAQWSQAFARNLNRFGLSLTLGEALPTGTKLELEIRLPDRVVRTLASARWTTEVRKGDTPRFANGLRFDVIEVEDQDAIARHVFWEIAPRHGELLKITRRAQRAAPVPS